MDLLIHAMIGPPIVGITALLGGCPAQRKAMGKGEARMVPAMLHGALTMLVTGMALAGPHRAEGHTVNTFKIGLKLALPMVVLALVYVQRDEEKVNAPVLGTVGALTTADIFITVLRT
ncbi:hypothetical protein [Streptomyces sp. I05A-00742]|uniref:hypothetical protein n=1 Tax=Streptomyces sp. I05A-00742 TaxID=2732853 RepID=UPI00148923AA|nr:hypothetical protein [Streptomyces sp. I05A-00742]